MQSFGYKAILIMLQNLFGAISHFVVFGRLRKVVMSLKVLKNITRMKKSETKLIGFTGFMSLRGSSTILVVDERTGRYLMTSHINQCVCLINRTSLKLEN